MESSGIKKYGYWRTTGALFRNGLNFRYRRLKNRPQHPVVMSLALTGRCNSHCIMCNIWKKPRDADVGREELSAREIIDLLSQPLFSELVELDLTGGEPNLREDLADIVSGIAGLRNSYLPRLHSIIVTSNGLLPRKVISNQQKMLKALNGTGIDLVSVHSIDGIGETHDLVRGTKNAFKLATETISGLTGLRQEYQNYFMGLKTTILPHNLHALGDILDFALGKGLFHIISPVFFTEGRFSNTEKKEELEPGTAGYSEIIRFYSRDELKSTYFYKTARESLIAGRKKWICTALNNYLYLEYDGKVYPCEMISESIGDIRKQDMADIWSGTSGNRWREKIGKLECCRNCIEPGAIRYSAFTEGFSYLRFLLSMGKQGALDNLKKEGFFKYLSP